MGSSILYTFSNECLPTGCVLSILCPPWAIQTKRPRIEYGVILIYGCWPQNLIAKCLIRTIRHEHNVTIHGCINRIILIIYTYINMLWVNIIIIWINRTWNEYKVYSKLNLQLRCTRYFGKDNAVIQHHHSFKKQCKDNNSQRSKLRTHCP